MRQFSAAVLFVCASLAFPASAVHSFGKHSNEFAAFKKAFDVAFDYLDASAAKRFMHDMEEHLGYLNRDLLSTFARYLSTFLNANQITSSNELLSFWKVLDALIDRLDENGRGGPKQRQNLIDQEDRLIERMTRLEESYRARLMPLRRDVDVEAGDELALEAKTACDTSIFDLSFKTPSESSQSSSNLSVVNYPQARGKITGAVRAAVVAAATPFIAQSITSITEVPKAPLEAVPAEAPAAYMQTMRVSEANKPPHRRRLSWRIALEKMGFYSDNSAPPSSESQNK